MRVHRIAVALLLALAATPLLPQQPQTDPARALFERVLRYRGGDKLRGIYAYRDRYTLREHSAKGDVESNWDVLIAFPDRIHAEVQGKFGKATVVIAPGVALLITNGQAENLPTTAVASWMNTMRDTSFPLARAWHDGNLSVGLAGSDFVNGTPVQLLDVRVGAETLHWYVEPKSGRVLRGRSDATDDKGVSHVWTTDYSDVRSLGGMNIIFRAEATGDTGETSVAQTQAMELNPPVEPSLFYRQPSSLDAVAFNATPASPAPLFLNGTLKVVTQPGAAQLYLDDVFKGATSESEGRLVLEDVAPGSHHVRLTAAGFKEWNKTVTVEAGDSISVDAALERAGPPPFSESDVEQMLHGGVSAKRAAVLVKERGVDFSVDDASEQRLRAAGADSDLLLAIAKAKK